MSKTVLDFSTRLPGPRATANLAANGFKVIKFEDKTYPDLFKVQPNPQFNHWYKSLNENKEIIEVDYNTFDFTPYLEKADLVLMGLNPKAQKKYNLDSNSLEKYRFSYIEIAANRDGHPAHDLNLLTENDFYKLHLDETKTSQRPPFIPVLGIEYSNYLSEKMLTSLINHPESFYSEKVYFEDVIQRLDFLNRPDLRPILHYGDFPCYRIYRSQDGDFISFAAVEEAFWVKFTELFDINLESEARFDTTGTIIKKLENLFSSLSTALIQETLANNEICINLVKKENL